MDFFSLWCFHCLLSFNLSRKKKFKKNQTDWDFNLLLSTSLIEQVFNVLICSIEVYLSVHFFMYNKCCAEVGSRDEKQLPIYTSSSPGMGILCVARVATFSVAVLAAACVVCPAGFSSPSELAGASSPGDLGPGWALHQPTTEPWGCSPAAVSRAAQGDLLCLTSCSAEKNNSGYPEERGGESLTMKSRMGSFLLSCLLQGLWQTGAFCGGSAAV